MHEPGREGGIRWISIKCTKHDLTPGFSRMHETRPDPRLFQYTVRRKGNRHRPRRRRLQAPKGPRCRSTRTDAGVCRPGNSGPQFAAKLFMQCLDALGVFVVGRVQRIQIFFVDDVEKPFAHHGQLQTQAAFAFAFFWNFGNDPVQAGWNLRADKSAVGVEQADGRIRCSRWTGLDVHV